WQITAPEKIPADSDEVSGLLQELDPLPAQEIVAANATDLKQYGLDDPAIALNIVEKGGPAQQLLIGDNTPVGSSAYAMIAGQPRVYTTAMEKKNVLDKSLTALREKRLLTETSDQMQRIELTHAGQTVTLAHQGSGWRMLQPAPYRADPLSVESLAGTLSEAEMDLTQPTSQEAAADWAHGSPIGSVKVTGPAGVQTLEVRRYKDEDYAKSSVVSGVFHVGDPLGDALAKTAADFREKQVFDFGDNDPDALGLQMKGAKNAALNLTLKHNALGWWEDGKKVNSDQAEALVSALRALAATTFTNSGFTTPEISVSVTSQSGKHQETVNIAKSGSRYLARRIDDPSLYVLDGGAVEGVESAARQMAASGVK
ncbi:MAG: DUF4340 domain-containing protein, partial [Acidobacteriota bacterium]